MSGPRQLVPEPSKWVGGVVVLVVDGVVDVVDNGGGDDGFAIVNSYQSLSGGWFDEVLVFNKSFLIAISRH